MLVFSVVCFGVVSLILEQSLAQNSITNDEFEWKSYRLPDTVSPTKYRIRLILDMFGNESDVHTVLPYDGSVNITLQFYNSTDLIVLHSVNLNIINVTATLSNGVKADISCYRINEKLEQLQIKLTEKYKAHTKMNLEIKFTGVVSDQLQGFYKGSYDLTPSRKRIIATTHMEAVSARKAFPCFDEPGMKAKFRLEISRPRQWMSLFNTKLEYSVPYDERRMLDIYGFTPMMSSYLVAFIVCDFRKTRPLILSSSIDGHPIEVAVSGRTDQLDQLTFARAVAGHIILAFEQFFQVSYPLPKVDMVAIPAFPAGAMENWGLLTYRDSSLLYDPKVSSTLHQKHVTTVVSHELAHQWFGNYVTMKWWNDVWLNEGFATFVGELIGSKSFATYMKYDWPITETFIRDITRGMETDGLLSSHPLSKSECDVNSEETIEELFDHISYLKGSAILNMLDTFVTRDVTKSALQHYLKSHKYSNAVQADLWASFDKAYKAKHPKASDEEISVTMKSWSELSGYPVLSVDINERGIHLSQSPYFVCKLCNKTLADMNKQWTVPIAYKRFSSNGSEAKSFILKKNSDVISADLRGKWVKVNTGWSGYYLVKYSDYSDINLSELSDIDVANILHDAFKLFKGGYIDLETCMDVMLRVLDEREIGYLTEGMMLNGWWYLLHTFADKPQLYKQISQQIFSWIDIGNLDVTYEAVDQLNTKERNNMGARLNMALYIDHEQVVRENRGLLILALLWRNSVMGDLSLPTGLIHKDVARAIWHCAFLLDEKAMWDRLWNRYMTANIPSEQVDYLIVLAKGKERDLLHQYMMYSLTKGKKDDTVSIITAVAEGKYGRDVAWSFLKQHWDTLFKKYGSVGPMINRLITLTASNFADRDGLEEVVNFFESRKETHNYLAVSQAAELIRSKISIVEENSAKALQYFTIIGENM